MKKFCLSILVLAFGLLAHAQNISVKSFKALPTDMTASSLEGKRIDQNGEVAALIKIVTPETGFTFEGGVVGIVDSKQETGEVWVWVPRASKKITIKHQQLGVLRDYYYPVELEVERTYEMVLITAKIETIIKEEMTKQYLIFELEPKNAILEVNDQLWSVDAEGTALQFVDFGTYTYRVRAANYETDAGVVTVDDPDPDNPKIVKVKLKSNFVEVTLTVDADAEIWVNNEKKGIRTWTGSLGKGSYKIECKQECHETSMISKEITAEMNGQTVTLPAPRPIYGSLNVESTPIGATIYIDDKEMGKTPKYINEVLIGQSTLRLVKEGYEEYFEIFSVAKGERKQVKAILNDMQSETKDEETFTVNGVSFTMKRVKGGTFQMGSCINDDELMGGFDPELMEQEYPVVHGVTLNNYYIGETEVTQSLWRAVMGNNPSFYQGDSLPVESVSWDDCQEFIRKLNQMTGKKFRLPTEAEWEFAARGGTKSKGYIYAGSNTSNVDEVAWLSNNSGYETHPVGLLRPNELGIYDMSGNVSEWCQDWYETYGSGSQVDPSGPSVGSSRVLRGGSWKRDKREGRVSRRNHRTPDTKYHAFGFRLCLSQKDNVSMTIGSQSISPTSSSSISNGALPGVFSVSPTQKVYFSHGNLQYQPSANKWRFAEHQWDFVGTQTPDSEGYSGGTVEGSDNAIVSNSYSGWMDFFGWCANDNPANYFICEFYSDWGSKIGSGWRTLTRDEWEYVFFRRSTSSSIRFVMGTVNGVHGVILLPDNWNKSTYLLNNTNPSRSRYEDNIISETEWYDIFEANGGVFMPAAGIGVGNHFSLVNDDGRYWTSTPGDDFSVAWQVVISDFFAINLIGGYATSGGGGDGCSVRLVRSAQ